MVYDLCFSMAVIKKNTREQLLEWFRALPLGDKVLCTELVGGNSPSNQMDAVEDREIVHEAWIDAHMPCEPPVESDFKAFDRLSARNLSCIKEKYEGYMSSLSDKEMFRRNFSDCGLGPFYVDRAEPIPGTDLFLVWYYSDETSVGAGYLYSELPALADREGHRLSLDDVDHPVLGKSVFVLGQFGNDDGDARLLVVSHEGPAAELDIILNHDILDRMFELFPGRLELAKSIVELHNESDVPRDDDAFYRQHQFYLSFEDASKARGDGRALMRDFSRLPLADKVDSVIDVFVQKGSFDSLRTLQGKAVVSLKKSAAVFKGGVKL